MKKEQKNEEKIPAHEYVIERYMEKYWKGKQKKDE